jgi:hypothetical protein
VGDQLTHAVDDGAAPRNDVSVGLSFHRLPSIRPEPGLIRWHRDNWDELDAAITVVDQADLRLWPIEVEPTPEVGWKGHSSPRLDREQVRLHPGSIAVLLQCVQIVVRS